MFYCKSYLYTIVLLNARIIIWLFVWHREFPVWGTHNLWTVKMIHDFQRQKLLALLTTEQLDKLIWFHEVTTTFVEITSRILTANIFPIPSALTTVIRIFNNRHTNMCEMSTARDRQSTTRSFWVINWIDFDEIRGWAQNESDKSRDIHDAFHQLQLNCHPAKASAEHDRYKNAEF